MSDEDLDCCGISLQGSVAELNLKLDIEGQSEELEQVFNSLDASPISTSSSVSSSFSVGGSPVLAILSDDHSWELPPALDDASIPPVELEEVPEISDTMVISDYDEVMREHSRRALSSLPGSGPFEIERIVDKRTLDDSVQYQVRWKGLPHSADSWVDEENLSADELVNKFECMQGRLLANMPENFAICHQCRRKRWVHYCGDPACDKKYCLACVSFYCDPVTSLVGNSEWRCPFCSGLCCCGDCARGKRKLPRGRGIVPERILARLLLQDQTTLYLVKWKDRHQRDATWEVAEDVENCATLLSLFCTSTTSVRLPCTEIRDIFTSAVVPEIPPSPHAEESSSPGKPLPVARYRDLEEFAEDTRKRGRTRLSDPDLFLQGETSEEDTSDEAYAKLHQRYETPKRKRKRVLEGVDTMALSLALQSEIYAA